MTIEKIKAGVFDGPRIQKLMNDKDFIGSMNPQKTLAWQALFIDAARNFLGNSRSKNYMKIVNNLIAKSLGIGANMSIKAHFLFSILDLFHENMWSVCDEQGERFHQDIKEIKTLYQGGRDKIMMAD